MKTTSPVFPFEHRELLHTALPLGGIGAGCISLNGYGGLQDFSIRNRPEFTSCPPLPGGPRPDAAFALLRIGGGKPVTRLVEGPLPAGKVHNQGLWTGAADTHRGGYEGLPRFKKVRFTNGYPFGRVELSDPQLPISVEIIGWNPFIPRDDIASGIPCSILEYRLRNESRQAVDFEFSYHLSHLAVGASGRNESTRNHVISGQGVLLTNTDPTGADAFGSASLTVLDHKPKIKAKWFQGGWFDAISALWREVESGKFVPNDGQELSGGAGRNGGSILIKGQLAPGKETIIPVVICWYFPNSSVRAYGWSNVPPPNFVPKENTPAWRPFYVSQWKDAAEVAAYVRRHYTQLRARTVAFQNALLSSTLPPEVFDAVSANLAIVKSPTLLRLENGNLWGWEGCSVDRGSCSGTCTHVWNYAQALPSLFPALERTLREQELKRSMDTRGHVNFRAALPEEPAYDDAAHGFHAAADGQLGGILKLYRDWQISGKTEWMEELYPLARRSLEYCIRTWDPDRLGGLFEPHHNTYDIEFWGPDGMCGSIYLGALSAMSAMATALGKTDDAQGYGDLAERAARFMEQVLFNGEYFEQKIEFKNLRNKTLVNLLSQKEENPEMLKLLREEGPKYQYGNGCLSDGVIGAWMTQLYGVETPLARDLVRKNLVAIHRHNFRRSLAGHANTQRAGYAMEDEGGLLLCSWPRGGKPTLPFIYSDEVWTGIEYQVASHLALEGYLGKALDLVRAVRRRYDGRSRNPWNEYECGSFYARAMASYALLASWSGFRYSAVEKTVWFNPKQKSKRFQVFFSTESGFGTVALEGTSLVVSILEGALAVERIVMGNDVIQVGKTALPGKPLRVRRR